MEYPAIHEVQRLQPPRRHPGRFQVSRAPHDTACTVTTLDTSQLQLETSNARSPSHPAPQNSIHETYSLPFAFAFLQLPVHRNALSAAPTPRSLEAALDASQRVIRPQSGTAPLEERSMHTGKKTQRWCDLGREPRREHHGSIGDAHRHYTRSTRARVIVHDAKKNQ